MPVLGIGEYRPDVNDLDGQHSRSLRNVLVRGDGYGPFKLPANFADTLPGRCRGGFYSRDTDGTVNVFAGTDTNLYLLDNETLTWTLVSAGGIAYTALSADALWQFGQFGTFVIAVHANVDPQVFTLATPTDFDTLAGSPPKAAYIAVVGRFVVLSGLTLNPYRTQWSGLGDAVNWTPGTFSSDYQDAPDGGIVRQILGGEVGFILQDTVIRRMIFSGGDIIFNIEKIAKDIGLLHPYAACTSGDKLFFLTSKGFVQTDSNGALTPIGAEKIDRTFLGSYDSSAPAFVQMAADPNTNTVMVVARRNGSSTDAFDMGFVYNWLMQRWTPVEVMGELITNMATPGFTLEGLGALTADAITNISAGAGSTIRITIASTTGMTTGDYKTISGVIGSFGDGTEVNETWPVTVIDGTKFDLQGSVIASTNVTGAANNGSGKVRLAVTSSAAWLTGDKVVIASIVGTTEANGDRVITVIDGTHVDIPAVNFVNAYVSGGTVKDRYDVATDGGIVEGSADDMETPWDSLGQGSLPLLALFDDTHTMAFFSGDNMEAELETPEQSGDSMRILVNGFWPITDATDVRGRLGLRDNLNSAFSYTSESEMTSDGFIPQLWSTRYVRGRVRIPEGTDWTFFSGVRPESSADGEF